MHHQKSYRSRPDTPHIPQDLSERARTCEIAMSALTDLAMARMFWMASGFERKSHRLVRAEELLGAAYEGLRQAVLAYDEEKDRCASFWTFAEYRVRGGMLDFMRTSGAGGRGFLSFKGASEDRRQSDEFTDDQRRRWRPLADMASLNRSVGHTGEPERNVRLYEITPARDPGDLNYESLETIAHLTAPLDEREQAIVVHSEINGYTMKAIGRFMGLSESRICQIRSIAIKKMALEYHADDDDTFYCPNTERVKALIEGDLEPCSRKRARAVAVLS